MGIPGRGTRRAVDRRLRRILRTSRAPGFVLGVTRRGRTVLERCFGHRDRERALPATVDTVYGVASITKSVSAVAVLRLAELGRLSLTDPVVRHIPGFRTPNPQWASRVRLFHLLSHSAGFPPLPGLYRSIARSLRTDPSVNPREYQRAGIDLWGSPIDTYAELVEYLAEASYVPLGPPGAVYSYSNEGFALIGAVVESASGTTYESFVDETLFKPARMESAGFDPGVLLRRPAVAELYTTVTRGHRSRVVAAPGYWEQSATRASGALRMDLGDLLRFADIFRSGGRIGQFQVVRRRSIEQITTPRIAVNPYSSYGLGVFLTRDAQGILWIHHSGSLKGVTSSFAVAPALGITGALLANVDGFPGTRTLNVALNAARGRPLDTPRVATPKPSVPEEGFTEYAGWFGCGEGYWIRIEPKRDHLRVGFHGIEVVDRGLKARRIGLDLFAIGPATHEEFLQFRRDERGRVRAVTALERYIRRRSAVDRGKARRNRLVW